MLGLENRGKNNCKGPFQAALEDRAGPTRKARLWTAQNPSKALSTWKAEERRWDEAVRLELTGEELLRGRLALDPVGAGCLKELLFASDS